MSVTPGSADELVAERDRVVRRLRSLAVDAVPAEAVRAASQELADLATRGEQPAVRRVVPVLAPHAAGDQVAVLVGEVLAAGDTAAYGPAAAVLARLRAALP